MLYADPSRPWPDWEDACYFSMGVVDQVSASALDGMAMNTNVMARQQVDAMAVSVAESRGYGDAFAAGRAGRVPGVAVAGAGVATAINGAAAAGENLALLLGGNHGGRGEPQVPLPRALRKRGQTLADPGKITGWQMGDKALEARLATMTEQIQQRVRVMNEQASTIQLVLEPWGEIHDLPSGKSIWMTLVGTPGGPLEILYNTNTVTVYVWEGIRLEDFRLETDLL